MTHLTPADLIDAMEGVLVPERRAHLAVCEECRGQLDDLAAVLNDAKEASIPEPSPLFWNHLSTRVRTAIDNDAGSKPTWLRWQTLVPVGAVATLLLVLMISVPRLDRPGTRAELEATVSADAVALDAPSENWDALAEIVGELDVETASAAGVIEPGFAEQAVLELTQDERMVLTRLLQTELARVKS